MDQRLSGLRRTSITVENGHSYQSQRYFDTLLLPCPICGWTWHKHELSCPWYHSIHPDRCRARHCWFLRSCDTDRVKGRYEYECNYCNHPPVFVPFEMKWEPHPFCANGEHCWTTCGDGCCQPWCSGCGKKGTLDNVRFQMWVINQWEK